MTTPADRLEADLRRRNLLWAALRSENSHVAAEASRLLVDILDRQRQALGILTLGIMAARWEPPKQENAHEHA